MDNSASTLGEDPMQFSSGAEAESGDTTSPRRSWHSTHFNVVFESGKDNENLRSPSFSFLTLAAPLDDDTAKHADNKGMKTLGVFNRNSSSKGFKKADPVNLLSFSSAMEAGMPVHLQSSLFERDFLRLSQAMDLDYTEDGLADEDEEDRLCTRSMCMLSDTIQRSPGTSLGDRTYLTAPCDGNPTKLTVHRHQEKGCLELLLDGKHGSLFLAVACKRRGCYELFLERPDSRKKPNPEDSNELNFLGKIMVMCGSTEYALNEWDNGTYRQTAGITFKKRFSATGAPRRLTIAIPKTPHSPWSKVQNWLRFDGDSLLSVYRAEKSNTGSCDESNIKVFKNVLPMWNDKARGYMLAMSSRIRIPSVKNFQIKQLPHGETEPSGEMVLEFGKACDKTFALDCRPPFSILQAFAVAIAIADSSLITTT